MNYEEQNNENNNQEKIHKPYSKYRNKDNENFGIKLNYDIKKLSPYLIILLIFFLSLYFVFLLFDGIIMPSIVHSRDLVKVPNLSGKSLDEAIIELQKNKLSYKVVQEIYSEEYPENVVVKHIPTSNLEIKEGRTIYLTLSKGKEMVAVPNLIGFPISIVRNELSKVGLELGEINYDNSEFIAKDTVMAQSISIGKMVPYGTSVNIVISLGSNIQISVPSLVGLRYDEVIELLQKTGLSIGEISYKQSETFTPNTIIGQDPEAGEFVDKSILINLIISK